MWPEKNKQPSDQLPPRGTPHTCHGVVHVEAVAFDFLQGEASVDEHPEETTQFASGWGGKKPPFVLTSPSQHILPSNTFIQHSGTPCRC